MLNSRFHSRASKLPRRREPAWPASFHRNSFAGPAAAASARPGAGTLPAFMDEIAAAIPEDLASLRPEDIRVEAEFADLVVTTDERPSTRRPLPPRVFRRCLAIRQVLRSTCRKPPHSPGSAGSCDRVSIDVPAQAVPIIPTPAEPVVNAQPPPVFRLSRRLFLPAVARHDPPSMPLGTVLPAIKIETPPLSPSTRQFQPVQRGDSPARDGLLAWSLFVLLALPMAFLAGLLIGPFLWHMTAGERRQEA